MQPRPRNEVILDRNQRRSLGRVQYGELVQFKRWDPCLSDITCSQIWVTLNFIPLDRFDIYPKTMALVEEIIKTKFLGHVMTEGQRLLLDTSRDEQRPSKMFDMTITEIIGANSGNVRLARGLIDKNTIIRAFPGDALAAARTHTPVINRFRYEFDLDALEAQLNCRGIGGLAFTLKVILEGIFGSESLPLPYCSSLRLARRKVKGVIFYEPSTTSTRTTLLARKMHKILGTMEPKIVTAGMSPKDLFFVFGEAIKDDMINRCCLFFGRENGMRNQLHLFIIEDVERLYLADQPSTISAVKRGHATLAALMDRLDNILIIGTTTRFDRIRQNVLRPGPFELQVKFELPTIRERSDILKLHTWPLMEKNCLIPKDLDIQEIALRTDGYTDVELKRLVWWALDKATKQAAIHPGLYPDGTRLCTEDFVFVLESRSSKSRARS